MAWNPLITLEVSQDWQLTPTIALNLGYFRLKFESIIDAPVLIAQVDPDSPNDVYDQRHIFTTTANRIVEFQPPPFFEQRALLLRIPDFPEVIKVEVEVSDVPFSQGGNSAPIPWDSPGAIGSSTPNSAVFETVKIVRPTSSGVSQIWNANPDFGYRFESDGLNLHMQAATDNNSFINPIFTITPYGLAVDAWLAAARPIYLSQAPAHNITEGYAFVYSGALFFLRDGDEIFPAYANSGNVYKINSTLMPI